VSAPPAPPADGHLTFFGAAGTVTGSKFLVRWQGRSYLLDCGLFQGVKDLRLRNWAPLPAPAAQPYAVVLSHAHLDHSGHLPRLARDGYRGPVHCTRGTAALLSLLLPDSARLQEEDAARANRLGYSKHRPALPLYTEADAERALRLVRPRPYDAAFSVGPGVDGRFRRAGHILGAATVELTLSTPGAVPPRRLVFSGDLGRWDRPILRDPDLVPEADVLLVEGTYGDRDHAPDPADALAQVITETARRGGVVVVPAFAVGRTQELLWTLRTLADQQRIPPVPVYLDSPLAASVTELYCRHHEDHDLEMRRLNDAGLCPLCTPTFQVVRTADESKALNARPGPFVVIAGSGMATGGRVLHHLRSRLPDPRHTVLLVGYQAEGTRGRLLLDGAPTIKMHGQHVPVRAQVRAIDGLSAHADRSELLRWMRGFSRPPRMTYVVHAEPGPGAALAATIREQLGWNAAPAADGETVAL
jgi:metallo-beta-lactamase family protein